MLKIFSFLIFLFAHRTVFAHEKKHNFDMPAGGLPSISLYEDYLLDQTSSFAKYNAKLLKGSPSVWVLFQPECKSCESQFRDLSCLPKEIKPLAVGFWGSREKLSKTIRAARFKGTVLIATPQFEKLIDLKLTPTTLLVDAEGKIRKTFLALTECQSIKNNFSKLQGPTP